MRAGVATGHESGGAHRISLEGEVMVSARALGAHGRPDVSDGGLDQPGRSPTSVSPAGTVMPSRMRWQRNSCATKIARHTIRAHHTSCPDPPPGAAALAA